MIHKTLSLAALLVLSAVGIGQDAGRIRTIKKDAIYIQVDAATQSIKYFNKHGTPLPVTKEDRFVLRDGEALIYGEWLNPLTNQITWSDQVSDDPTDVQLAEFFDALGQIGPLKALSRSPLADGNQGPAGTGNGLIELSTDDDSKKIAAAALNSITVRSLILDMMILERAHPDSAELPGFNNSILEHVSTAALSVNSNIYEAHSDYYSLLFDITNWAAVAPRISGFNKDEIENYSAKALEEIAKAKGIIEALDEASKTREIALLAIEGLTEECERNIERTTQVLSEITKAHTKLEKSLENPAPHATRTGYFQIKYIDFAQGKVQDSKLSIIQRKGDGAAPDTLVDQTLHFNRNRGPVRVVVSTGAFFTSNSIATFAVKKGDAGQSTIGKEVLNPNKGGTAMYLNLQLFPRWQASPIWQLGIDPTKAQPFVLSGVGLMFPQQRFAITGGLMMSWTSHLKDGFDEGQVVGEDFDITEATEYRFNDQLDGFYFGIQYNITKPK